MNKEQLIDFETRVANKFNNAEIKAPVHLYHGNEEQMLKVFERIDIKNDWVCCTWRNHYQCLLKGVPEDFLMDKIVSGKSMVMNLPEYKIVSSSIVGGIPSIAVGIAQAIKSKRSYYKYLKDSPSRVWCWIGDMSSETGAFHEAYKYAFYHDLPITFVVENNRLSVTSPTEEVWGRKIPWYFVNLDPVRDGDIVVANDNLIYYEYTNEVYPHAGAGVRVKF